MTGGELRAVCLAIAEHTLRAPPDVTADLQLVGGRIILSLSQQLPPIQRIALVDEWQLQIDTAATHHRCTPGQ